MKKVTKILYKCGCSTKIELMPEKFDAARRLICPNCGIDYGQQVGHFMTKIFEVNAAIEKFNDVERGLSMLEVVE